jgi:cbb3-type cytochrome oxidase maturation protein
MEMVGWLIPIALVLGLAGLGGFFWSIRSGQFDDPEGAASRILIDDDQLTGSRSDEGERPARG